MPTFRIHTADGAKHEITADTPDQARKIAADRHLGIVVKVKLVKENA